MDKKSVEGQPAVRLCNYTDVYYRERITPEQRFMEATATPEQVESFRLLPGDVIITKDSETPDDIAVPAFVAGGAPDLVCGYHLAVLRPRPAQVDPRFLYWSICSQDVRAQLTVAATGVTRFGLRRAAINGTRISIPSLDEQRRIADFLDLETARIDALLDRNRRLHSLTAERYLALIDSISKQHCPQSVPLKRLARITYGLGQPPTLTPGGVPIIRATNIDRGKIRPVDLIFADPNDLPLTRAPLLEEGEILVVRSGALTGDSAMVTAEWAGSTPGYDLRLRPMAIDPKFLAHQLQGPRVQAQIAIVRARAAQPHLNAEDLGETLVMSGLPEHERAAARELDTARARLDALGSRFDALRRVMKERRDALITAAVTGRLDPTTYRASALTT